MLAPGWCNIFCCYHCSVFAAACESQAKHQSKPLAVCLCSALNNTSCSSLGHLFQLDTSSTPHYAAACIVPPPSQARSLLCSQTHPSTAEHFLPQKAWGQLCALLCQLSHILAHTLQTLLVLLAAAGSASHLCRFPHSWAVKMALQQVGLSLVWAFCLNCAAVQRGQSGVSACFHVA